MESDRKQREAQRQQAELERRKTRLLEIEERKRLAELAEAEARAQREQEAANRPVYPGYVYPIPLTRDAAVGVKTIICRYGPCIRYNLLLRRYAQRRGRISTHHSEPGISNESKIS